MPDKNEKHLVRCFLRHRGEILVVRSAGSDAPWDAISEEADEEPETIAKQLADEACEGSKLIRRGNVSYVPQENEDLYIRSFLFDCRSPTARMEAAYEWISPTEILQRPTTPELWASYADVAPSVEQIRHDANHGASYLSIRALEVLRDWAGRLTWQRNRGQRLSEERLRKSLFNLAEDLIQARPSMAVIRNRVNRVMTQVDGDIAQIADAAHDLIREAYNADEETASRAARVVGDQDVLTFSYSDTVIKALAKCKPAAKVYVCLSTPGSEGTVAAEQLEQAGCSVTILPDAAIASLFEHQNVDLVLTGADSATADGDVINKTGSHTVAIVATAYDVPFYAVCSSDKIAADDHVKQDETSQERLYNGPATLQEFKPLFEKVPAERIAGIITEQGVITPDRLTGVAGELEKLNRWREHK